MSVVLDTNTLISAIIWDGSIAEKMLTEFIKNQKNLQRMPYLNPKG